MRDEMPFDEFKMWMRYFRERPLGWREDDRTHKLMRTFGSEAKGEEIFPSLRMMQENIPKMKPGQIDVANLKQSTMFSKMLGAKGGDDVDFS